MSSDNSPTDLAGVVTAAGLQTAISIGLFIGFSLLRPRNKIVYEPRSKFAPEQKRPQPLSGIPTAWLRPTLFTNENQLVDKIGLDAVMFLRFIRLCFQFFLGLTCIGIPLCIFHFYAPRFTGGSNRDSVNSPDKQTDQKSPQLAALTINNVYHESSWFWMHAVLVWVFSMYAYYLMYRLWMDWIRFRREFFFSSEFQSAFHNRTLILTNLPDSMRSPQDVTEFMTSLNLKDSIRQAVIGREVGDLPKLIEEHQKVTAKLEDVLAIYLKDPYRVPTKRPTHKINKKLLIFGGQKVDSIEYCSGRLHALEREIYELRSKGDHHFKPNANAFVSFRSVQAAHSAAIKLNGVAAVALRSRSLSPPSVKLSPDFDDIIWQNVGISAAIRHTRRLMALGIVIAVTLSWSFLIIFITGLVSLGTIEKYVPKLAEWIEERKAATVILTSIIAPVLFSVLQILPPIGFRFLARFQGVLSSSGVEKSVMHKVFAFQVYQYAAILLINLSATTIGSILNFSNGDVGASTRSIFNSIAVAFIDKSSFFIAMIVTGMTSIAIELIQGVPLVLGFIKRHLFANTPRKEFDYNQAPALPYGPIYALILIKFLLGVCYSVAAPLILPFTSAFFFAAYLVYKYQLIYVYETPLETGGTWWPKVFTLLCICIGSFQLMTLGAILLIATGVSAEGNGKRQAIMLVVLMCLNVVYWWACRRWLAPQGFMSKSDLELVESAGKWNDNEELEDRVYNPALVKPLWRVWVWKQAREVQDKYYTPEYQDIEDFIRKTRPVSVGGRGEVGSTDDFTEVAGTIRRNAKRVLSFYHRHPLHSTSPNAEAPPELEHVAQEAGESLPIVVAVPDDEQDPNITAGSGLPTYSSSATLHSLERPYELQDYASQREIPVDVRSFSSTENLNSSQRTGSYKYR
ncbi:uncharacterized protein SPPG_05148 [Spizellomyces punctatus DAOM BR117]|uniref:DUF221-domain-containing protein n=1 Tax=Spizellomyces punctatus (strain DAOM BR117) TaxID=645134 RepID=A0A0L0HE86_SPIPD|nr:uncharacterized protein SPPG_05148 [Spizellomyces punctatus DAOM BR117]KNC99770.1 hypothetical protein SPPG_05148 [Spizellomyces punctatus DAOM BR117]|eukprot:XP_016607810.1 hypothetical protein SPPG_05148 [Spizellomyces punctatus DAOM BR117]